MNSWRTTFRVFEVSGKAQRLSNQDSYFFLGSNADFSRVAKSRLKAQRGKREGFSNTFAVMTVHKLLDRGYGEGTSPTLRSTLAVSKLQQDRGRYRNGAHRIISSYHFAGSTSSPWSCSSVAAPAFLGSEFVEIAHSSNHETTLTSLDKSTMKASYPGHCHGIGSNRDADTSMAPF